jgi:hypothetical protein
MVVSGVSSVTSGFSNNRGFIDTQNYFDVAPPAGYTHGNLLAFVPSIWAIYFNGDVDGNDSMRCTYSVLNATVLRIWVQNSEQRATPAASWLGIWGRN